MNHKNLLLPRFCVLSSVLLFFLSGVFLSAFSQTKGKPFVVVLDAGHGGKDPGKIAGGVQEKDLALKVVLELGSILEKHSGIKVVYTRKKDVAVDLFMRGKIANKAKADLFISVHCNAHSSQVKGAETFVLGLNTNKQNLEVAKNENKVIYLEDNYQKNYEGYDINSPESVIGITITQEEFLNLSVEFASYVQRNLVNNLHKEDRGIKQAGFIVLHQTFMPGVLIEIGFITNKSERKFLLSSQGQKQIAANIADAVLEYKKIHGYNPPKKNIYYKVQIVASTEKVDLKPLNFKGLSNITIDKSDKFYRYYYGKASTYAEALKLKSKAEITGYKDCYIVAYNGSEKIPVKEARSIEKED